MGRRDAVPSRMIPVSKKRRSDDVVFIFELENVFTCFGHLLMTDLLFRQSLIGFFRKPSLASAPLEWRNSFVEVILLGYGVYRFIILLL